MQRDSQPKKMDGILSTNNLGSLFKLNFYESIVFALLERGY